MTSKAQVLPRVRTLIKRLDALLEGNTNDWHMDWDIIKNDILELVRGTFDKNSKEYSIVFDVFKLRTISIYGSPFNNWRNDYGEPMLRALRLVEYRLKHGQTTFAAPASTELLVEPETQHSAYVYLRDLVKAATRLIVLVDPYVDQSVLSLLANASATVEVRILTRMQNVPPDLLTEAQKLRQQYGTDVTIRVGLKDFHDRFLGIDDRLFLSGASFKDAGEKGSVVTEIRDNKKRTLTLLEARWTNAKPLK